MNRMIKKLYPLFFIVFLLGCSPYIGGTLVATPLPSNLSLSQINSLWIQNDSRIVLKDNKEQCAIYDIRFSSLESPLSFQTCYRKSGIAGDDSWGYSVEGGILKAKVSEDKVESLKSEMEDLMDRIEKAIRHNYPETGIKKYLNTPMGR